MSGPLIGARCTVCNHADLGAIEAAIKGGRSKRLVAKDYNLGHDAVNRHAANHMTLTAPGGWAPPDPAASWRDKMEALAKALEQGRVRPDVASQLRLAYKELDEAGKDMGPSQITVAELPWLAEMLGDLLMAVDRWPQARDALKEVLQKHGVWKGA